jgi:hypothetical protein
VAVFPLWARRTSRSLNLPSIAGRRGAARADNRTIGGLPAVETGAGVCGKLCVVESVIVRLGDSRSVAVPRRAPRGLFEALLIAGLYLASELSRGLAGGGRIDAERHAAAVVRLERHLHVFGEAAVQRVAHHVYGLPQTLGYAYLTLHLALTALALVWVYRHRRHAYRQLRNTLVVANGLAVAGYALFPTAPPRLAGVGISDTVSGATSINLTSNLVSRFYNPYAAMPSMHIGFSLIVGVVVWKLAQGTLWRVAGLVYPVFVLLVIVATGNHFFLDAAAGAAVAAAAAGVVAVSERLRPAAASTTARRAPSRSTSDPVLRHAA